MRTLRRPDRWQASRAVAGASLALVAGASFAPAFGHSAAQALTDPAFVLPVAGAVVAVAATSLLLAAGTRLAPVNRVAVAIAVLAGYVLLAVAPGASVAAGPRRLLTSALPVDPTGPELATVVLLVGLTTLGAVEPALRRRAALLPSLAPLAATVTGTAVTAGAGAPAAGGVAVAFAAGAVALLLLARQADRTPGPGRPVTVPAGGALPAAVLAAVVAAAWLGPGLLAGVARTEPVDLRQLVPSPVDPRETTSPLVLFPALRTGDQQLSLTVTSAHRPDRLRYASLDTFDGQFWTATPQYRRAGTRLPLRPDGALTQRREEHVTVEVAGPLGWLVASGRPVAVSVAGLGVDEATGDVALPADQPVPQEYTVWSAVPVLNAAMLAATDPQPQLPPAAEPWLSSEAGQRLAAEAREIVATASGGSDQLRQLERHLRTYQVDTRPQAPTGHGLPQLVRLLETQAGTAEQYASAFAVLARTLGYQSRVVVGFRAQQISDDTYRVTGRDVHAWAEVRFETAGWVPFDPTPRQQGTGDDDSGEDERPEDRPGRSVPDREAEDEEQPAGIADQGGRMPGAPGVARVVGLGLASLAALLVFAAGGVVLAKPAVRRRRRRRGDPARQALGAWRDSLDRLVEAGLAVSAADTSGEVVARARRRFGDRVAQPLHQVALVHDAAAYAPLRLAASAAAAAWSQAEQLRLALRTALHPVTRCRARLSPRPFWRTSARSAR